MTTLYIIGLSFVLLWFSILGIKFLRKNKYINPYESLAKILGFIFTFATLISLWNLQTERPISTQVSVQASILDVLWEKPYANRIIEEKKKQVSSQQTSNPQSIENIIPTSAIKSPFDDSNLTNTTVDGLGNDNENDTEGEIETFDDPNLWGDMSQSLAAYPTGLEGLTDYLTKRIIFSPEVRRLRQHGTVKVKFHIDEYGEISNIEITNGIHTKIDQVTIKAISEMPAWIPATNNGFEVGSIVELPITIR